MKYKKKNELLNMFLLDVIPEVKKNSLPEEEDRNCEKIQDIFEKLSNKDLREFWKDIKFDNLI